MEFSPHNHIVKLCLKGMSLEENGDLRAAKNIFLQAWDEATNDFEKFLAAYYLGRQEQEAAKKLSWLEIALAYASKIDDNSVRGVFPALYSNIAKCHEVLGALDQARRNNELAESYKYEVADEGPFYHGTRAAVQVGDLLTAGFRSNYHEEVVMNHIYFTAVMNGAGLAAALARGEGRERIYIVEPTGDFENDPNVTDKKFPGNPTRSYRSEAPLKVVGEVTDWEKLTPEQIQAWRERLAKLEKAEIIN